jgi:hypothetical protein
MQIRCYRCGWSFAIKKEEAAFALEALEETGGTHYDTNCPRCRHSNRVSLEQLRKAVPRSAAAEPAPDEDQDIDVEGSEQDAEPVMENSEAEADSGEPESAD